MGNARKLDDVEAETRSKGSFQLPLADVTVWVKSISDWPVSALRAIKDGDFDRWAEKCLVEGNYEMWQMVDPTLSQVEDFFGAMNRLTGTNPGK